MADQTSRQPERLAAPCRQFEQQLAAYLEEEDRPEVAAHARHCSSCQAIVAELEAIRRTSRQLPLLEPLPTVWANIRAALEAEGILREPVGVWRRWLSEVSLALRPAPGAALASLMIVGWALLGLPGSWQQREVTGWPASSQSELPGIGMIPLGEAAEMARTIREVESIYRTREMLLEPTLKATYRQSLEALNRSITECLFALQQQPTNTLAREYLRRALREKAEVLAAALNFGGP